MELNYSVYPSETDLSALKKPPILIIPGLFGSNVNWRSFANKLSDGNVVIAIDQRNHGRSPHRDSNTYFDLVDDLFSFLRTHNIEKIIACGHSMGGKTAMLFCLLHPARVERLVVLDIAPVAYQHSHAPFLEALLDIDLQTLKSRKEADRALQGIIPETSTRLFLLQSLTGSPGDYKWRLNLPVLHQFMPMIVSFPDEALVRQKTEMPDNVPSKIPVLFVRGSESNYVLPEHSASIAKLFENVDIKTLQEAGHWLHVDQPMALLNTLQIFLKNE